MRTLYAILASLCLLATPSASGADTFDQWKVAVSAWLDAIEHLQDVCPRGAGNALDTECRDAWMQANRISRAVLAAEELRKAGTPIEPGASAVLTESAAAIQRVRVRHL